MLTTKDAIIPAIIALALAITGAIVDSDEQVAGIGTSIFEILVLAFILYAIIVAFYFPIKVLVYKFRKQRA